MRPIPDTKQDQRIDFINVEFNDIDHSVICLSWQCAYEHIINVLQGEVAEDLLIVPEHLPFQAKVRLIEERFNDMTQVVDIPDNYYFMVYTSTIVESAD